MRDGHTLCRQMVLKHGGCFCDRYFYLRLYGVNTSKVSFKTWHRELSLKLEGISFRLTGYRTVLNRRVYVHGERALVCILEYFHASDRMEIARRFAYDRCPGVRLPFKEPGIRGRYIGDFVCTQVCCFNRVTEIVNGFDDHLGCTGCTYGSDKLLDDLLVDYKYFTLFE